MEDKKNKKVIIILIVLLVIIIGVLGYFFLIKKDKIYHNTEKDNTPTEIEDNDKEETPEVVFEGDIFKSNKACDFDSKFIEFMTGSSEDGTYNYFTDNEEYYFSEIEETNYSNISYEITDKSSNRKKAACVVKNKEIVLSEENSNNDCYVPRFSTLAGKYIVLENRCFGSGEDYDSKLYTNDLKLLSDDFDDYVLNSDDTLTIEKGNKKTTYNKSGKKVNSTNNSTNNSDIKGYKKESINIDGNNPVLFYPENINKTYLTAYNTLVTNGYMNSLYLGKATNIAEISDNDMIKHALANYLLENKLLESNASNIECFYDVDNDEVLNKVKTSDKCKGIKKSKVDEYIKDKFNTNRVFKIKNHNVIYLPVSEEPLKFIYDETTDSYYYGAFPQSGGGEWISRWLLKVEEKGDYLVFYDKAMYCAGRGGWGSMYCYLPGREVDLFNILEDDYSASKKELLAKNEIDGVIYDLNHEYIFENYEMVTYKHTFKKVNDNYYWESSEIVKQ